MLTVMTGMRTSATMAAGLTLLLAAAACSSGSSKALVQDTQSPALSGPSAAPPATTTASSPAGTRPGASTNPSTAATSTEGTRTSAPANTKPAAKTSTSTPQSTATTASTCTTAGSTTTIQMVTGDRFTPSSVTINRCDAVKAVYADSTGAPHNWQGKGWMSPDMSSAGQSYTFRFSSAGTFNFFCSYHQSLGMTGTVTVH